jgi:hypothetical protein
MGVQRPATALTGPDPAPGVCRQVAQRVNSTKLLVARCIGLLGGACALGALACGGGTSEVFLGSFGDGDNEAGLRLGVGDPVLIMMFRKIHF